MFNTFLKKANVRHLKLYCLFLYIFFWMYSLQGRFRTKMQLIKKQ